MGKQKKKARTKTLSNALSNNCAPKGQSGEATSFLSRTQAQRKLQLSLADFRYESEPPFLRISHAIYCDASRRRLCILKGIYPHVPHKKKVVNRGNSANKTFYYVKDIQFLAHEPILFKFRDFKAFMKKFRRAVHRDDDDTTRRLDAVRRQPFYTLDHIVKERY